MVVNPPISSDPERLNSAAAVNDNFTLALVQTAGRGRYEDNVQALVEIVDETLNQYPETKLVVFPEGFLTNYYVSDVSSVALPLSQVHDTLAEVATAKSTSIAAGYHEHTNGGIFNSAAVVDHEGNLLVNFNKFCLWDEFENENFVRGETIRCFEIDDWKIGVCICYDIEFPEMAREYGLAGVDLIIVPSASMDPYEDLVMPLLPARAIENGTYVAYANRTGAEKELVYYGCSRIVDPYGRIVASADDRGEQIVVAELSKPSEDSVTEHLEDFVRYFQEG